MLEITQSEYGTGVVHGRIGSADCGSYKGDELKPKLLDLFCGAGGAAMGYHRAGFEVTGVDVKPQPHYPFEFLFGDARDLSVEFLQSFDAIHASPPCQHYSQCTPKRYRSNHPDLIESVRQRLLLSGKLFVIENVPSAKRYLNCPLMLCGSMFGLPLRRHRFFELSGFQVGLQPPCDHRNPPVLITGTHRRTYEPRYEYSAEQCRQASGLTWMTRQEMDQAIPPAYTEFIGKELLKVLGAL